MCEQAESRRKRLLAQDGGDFHCDSPCKQVILYLVSERQFYWVESKVHTVVTGEIIF